MRGQAKLKVMASLLLGVAGAATLSMGPSGATTGSGQVRVAVEGPMTGPQASTGIDMLRGAQLAAQQLNARGGVGGQQVTVVPANDQADPAAGVRAARRVVSSGIPAVIGPFNSGVGVKNLGIYRSAGTTIVRLTSATPTEGFGVTTQPMANQIAPVELQELTTVLHAKSVNILYDPSSYTAGIAHQLSSLLKAKKVSVPVDVSLSPTATSRSVSSVLGSLRKKHADVTYLAMYGRQAGLVAKALFSSSSGRAAAGRCFVDLAAQGPDFVAAAGTTVAPMCLNSGVPSAAELPGGAAYVQAYEARFHTAPGTWGAFTYDSLGILAKAAASSHQWHGSQVRSALAHTTGYSGVTGTISIQPNTGNRTNPPVVILDITQSGSYVVDPTWVGVSGYQLPPAAQPTGQPAS